MPLVFFFIIAGLGCDSLSKRGGSKYFWLSSVLVICGIQAYLSFRTENQSQNYAFANFARYVAAPIKEGASIFLANGDLPFTTVRYQQSGESLKQNMCIMNRRLMSYPWHNNKLPQSCASVKFPASRYLPGKEDAYDLKSFFDANYQQHSIFISAIDTSRPSEAGDVDWKKDYELLPYGLVHKVVKKDAAPSIEEYRAESKKYLLALEAIPRRKNAGINWEDVAAGAVFRSAPLSRGVFSLESGKITRTIRHTCSRFTMTCKSL